MKFIIFVNLNSKEIEMRKYLYAAFLLLGCNFVQLSQACTTAVISGRCTVDGRPLLFKQRDASDLNNRMVFFHDGKYPYIGLCDKKDPIGKEVWGGHNTAGFAIINSASYNLNINDKSGVKDLEGFVMKHALQQCATLHDFELMLDTMKRPMGCNANFGVIDAQGGAAYYETGNYGYVKFDVNDSVISSRGYLLRTNFCMTGKSSLDKGVSRYYAEKEIFNSAYNRKIISAEFLLTDVAHCLLHGLTHTNLYDQIPQSDNRPVFVPFRDYIMRYITSSTLVIEGVAKGENPLQTICWTILGSPLCSVAIPLWIIPSGQLPVILQADKQGNAPLCQWTLNLKKSLFPIEAGEGIDYINLAKLVNRNRTGIMQRTAVPQDSIVRQGRRMMLEFRKNKDIIPSQIDAFYKWVDTYVTTFYTYSFSPYDKSPASPRPGTM
jgi:hypothetical protein